MITRKRLREPLSSKIIKWSSIIGALAALAFCVTRLLCWYSPIQSILSFYSPSRYLRATYSLSFFRPSNSGPNVPGALTSVAEKCLYLWLSLGPSTTTSASSSAVPSHLPLARNVRAKFVQSMVSQKTTSILTGSTKTSGFDRFFIFMMIWPISPADFLCMLAGLTNMTFKR